MAFLGFAAQQSCLRKPVEYFSSLGSVYHVWLLSDHILQAVLCSSHVRLFATPWTVAHWAPLSMGFSRQDYWSGLPCPSPGDQPDPGIEPGSLALQWGSLPLHRMGRPVCSLFHVKNRLMTTRARASGCVLNGIGKRMNTFQHVCVFSSLSLCLASVFLDFFLTGVATLAILCHGSGIDRLSHLPGSTSSRSLCSDSSLSPGWPACVLPLGLVGRDQTG